MSDNFELGKSIKEEIGYLCQDVHPADYGSRNAYLRARYASWQAQANMLAAKIEMLEYERRTLIDSWVLKAAQLEPIKTP